MSNANAMTFQSVAPFVGKKQHFAVQLGGTEFDNLRR
jgi:hypothetical protein